MQQQNKCAHANANKQMFKTLTEKYTNTQNLQIYNKFTLFL